MNKNNFLMFGDCILVKPIIKKQSTKLIRQNEFDYSSSHFGEVVSVSSDVVLPNLFVGKIVVFDVYSAEKFVYDDVLYYIVHVKDIFAIMKEDI